MNVGNTQRNRRRLPSPGIDSRRTRDCASLSCDVDARISCAGKTFQTKLFGNNQSEKHRKLQKLYFSKDIYNNHLYTMYTYFNSFRFRIQASTGNNYRQK